jgi:hypothetical protein
LGCTEADEQAMGPELGGHEHDCDPLGTPEDVRRRERPDEIAARAHAAKR